MKRVEYARGGFVQLLVVQILITGCLMAQPDRRPLLTVGADVVDVAQQPSGRVWLVTRNFNVYTALLGERGWTHEIMEFENPLAKVRIQRVARLLFMNETEAVLVGDVLSYEKGLPLSCVLRTSNGGKSWATAIISSDTLAITDGVRSTLDGVLQILDQVGRYWTSKDRGLTWNQVPFPQAVANNDVKELDMTSSIMGAVVDRARAVTFTTNSWQSTIIGKASSRPLVRSQPSMLDQLSWSRDFMMWNDRLILIEGNDVFVTLLNDLIWERWDNVSRVCMSDDRMYLYYLDVNSQLWQWKTGEPSAKKLGDGFYSPRLMRAAHGRVILYRPDTGPIVVDSNSVTTRMRMYADRGEIVEPRWTSRDKDTEWGIDWVDANDNSVDVYKRTLPKGLWERDTFLMAGKTLFRAIGDDSLIFGEGSSASLYDARARQLKRYSISKPIQSFLSTPIAAFRVLSERSSGRTTGRMWSDYRFRSGKFQSNEVVDSSSTGVQSQTFLKSYTREEINGLVSSINSDANAYPTTASLSFSEAEKQSYREMLDTIFRYDGYFDTLDLYCPPPSTSQQIDLCKSLFSRVLDELPSISDQRLASAITGFRHWPTDREMRYAVEFTNVAGDILVVEMDRTNEVHLPMMMPWRISYRGQAWHWYGQKMAPFFVESIAVSALPPLVHRMMNRPWMLLAIASSLDAERYGRFHRWYQRPWKE